MSILKINTKSMTLIWVLMATGQASAFVGVPNFTAYFTVGARWLVGKAKVGGKLWDAAEAEKWNKDLQNLLAAWSETGGISDEGEDDTARPPRSLEDISAAIEAAKSQLGDAEAQLAGLKLESGQLGQTIQGLESDLRGANAAQLEIFNRESALVTDGTYQASQELLEAQRVADEIAANLGRARESKEQTDKRIEDIEGLLLKIEELKAELQKATQGQTDDPQGRPNGADPSSSTPPPSVAPDTGTTPQTDITEAAIEFLKAFAPTASDSTEKDYDLEMVPGKIWDVNVGFSGLIPLNDIFSIGGFVKAGWTNSEYKLGGSYKFASSVSGAIGLAIGVTRFLEIRAGFGVFSHQFSYEACDDLKNNMDGVTSNATELKKQAETQDLGDQAGKFNDLTTVSDDYTKARSANAILMHFVAEALVKIPISGALDFVVSLGMTNPAGKATFAKVGQGQTDVTVRPPVSVSLGVGLGYCF